MDKSVDDLASDAAGENPSNNHVVKPQVPREELSELAHRERQIAAFRSISEALFDHLTVDEVVREILRVAIEILQADVGSLQLYDAKTDSLVFRYVQDPAAQNLIGHAIPASHGISGHVFRTGVSQITLRASQDPDFNAEIDEMTGYHTESMLTVALKRFGGEPIGVIQILNARRPWDQRDLEVLEVLCAQAATSLETARLVEQARRAEILTLIGDISHEIKNMLTPIKTGAWTLESVLKELSDTIQAACQKVPPGHSCREEIESAMSKAQRDYSMLLENAISAAEKLEARTKEIADAIKGESAPLTYQELDLNSIAREVVNALELVANNAGVELRLDLDQNLPLAQLDSRQMYSALYNLTNNALPATPSGGSITLRTRSPQADDGKILVEVEDTGCGMPEHVRERAFTDAPISTKPGGTGLGTRIVAGAVRRHGGTLELDSEEGRGTTISIRLPIKQKPDSLSPQTS